LPINKSPDKYVSWTFRKKEKFFDVVTYTGNYTAGRTVSHSLGSVPAMIIVKCTSGAEDWAVYHQGSNGGTNPENYKLILNNTSAAASGYWNSTAPTDSSFTVSGHGEVNGNGATYVAYLFADNSAEDAEDQMIKCGSYSGTGSNQNIDLGWEAQWVLIKATAATGNWVIFDTMRGMPTEGIDGSARLQPNTTSAESELGPAGGISSHSRGFTAKGGSGDYNQSGNSYIYMAIRAPMMVEPEAATDVFAMDTFGGGPPAFTSGFPVDFAFQKWKGGTGNWSAQARLTGNKYLKLNATDAEATGGDAFDYQNGFYNHSSTDSSVQGWMWKRAKGYFDVVAWNQPNDTANTLVNHSLGVAPEMIWTKCRDAARGWVVYYGSSTHFLQLNQHYAHDTQQPHNTINETSFKVNGSLSGEIGGNNNYISYLFATLAGISKVGSYTGNGSSQTISCGFSAGSRFILIKRVDVASAYEGWWLWDATRGIVAGNDPHKRLNHNGSQVDTVDSVDPANAGFIVNQNSTTNINVSSGTYIFYAIA